jgi:hypothetical protein
MSKALESAIGHIRVNVSIYVLGLLFGATCLSTWRAAEEFYYLRRAVELQWNYPMEKESWDKFSRLNPEAGIPDVEKIRKDHVTQTTKREGGKYAVRN